MQIEVLKNAIVPNMKKNPEKSHATFERIEEVIKDLYGKNTESFINQIRQLADVTNERAYLSDKQADVIARNILEVFDAKRNKGHLYRFVEQLENSEISTREAIDLNKKHGSFTAAENLNAVPMRGTDSQVFDTEGTYYYECNCKNGASLLGMSNEMLAKGIGNQAMQLINTGFDHSVLSRTRFFKECKLMMPERLSRYFFQTSSRQSIEKAIHIAKVFTGTNDVVICNDDEIPVELSTFGSAGKQTIFHKAAYNNIQSIKDVCKKTGAKTVLISFYTYNNDEIVQADPTFIKELWDIAEAEKLVIIADETETGLGRTASKRDEWFSCMKYDVTPDILVIGEGLGGGFPVSSVVTSDIVADSFIENSNDIDSEGNSIAMTAALITSRQLRFSNITEQVVKQSKLFKDKLQQIKENFSFISSVYVDGLLMAVTFQNEDVVEKAVKALFKNNIKASLTTGRHLWIFPPLIISSSETADLLEKLEKAFSEIG